MAGHKKIRTFTATEQDLVMLETVARYHGFSKSGTITSLIKKEFWRLFPRGTIRKEDNKNGNQNKSWT